MYYFILFNYSNSLQIGPLTNILALALTLVNHSKKQYISVKLVSLMMDGWMDG